LKSRYKVLGGIVFKNVKNDVRQPNLKQTVEWWKQHGHNVMTEKQFLLQHGEPIESWKIWVDDKHQTKKYHIRKNK